MRMKTIRDLINKSGIKIKVVMIMWIIFQWHLNILASPFPAFRNFHHPPFSLQKISRSSWQSSAPLPVVYIMNAALTSGRCCASTLGIPLSCLQKFSPSPLFSSKNFKILLTIICSPPCGIHNECSLNKWPVLCIRLQPSWVCVQSSEVVTVGSTIAGSATNNTLTTEISSLHWSIPCITVHLF